MQAPGLALLFTAASPGSHHAWRGGGARQSSLEGGLEGVTWVWWLREDVVGSGRLSAAVSDVYPSVRPSVPLGRHSPGEVAFRVEEEEPGRAREGVSRG